MDLVPNRLGISWRDFTQQGEARFSFGEGHQGLLVVFSEHSIYFPVTQALSGVDKGGTLFDRVAIEQFAPSIVRAIPFPSLLLATQMLGQVTTSLLISQNMLVDPFMTNANLLLLFQSARDLFRAPLLSQQFLHPHPRFSENSADRLRLSFCSQLLCLLRTIATSSSIAPQFSAHS